MTFPWAQKRGGARFDLNGDLSVVPTPYLIVCLKRARKADMAQRIADELTKRGVKGPDVTANATTTCDYCEKTALYRCGQHLSCADPEHKEAATKGRKIFNKKRDERSAVIERNQTEYDRTDTQRRNFHKTKNIR